MPQDRAGGRSQRRRLGTTVSTPENRSLSPVQAVPAPYDIADTDSDPIEPWVLRHYHEFFQTKFLRANRTLELEANTLPNLADGFWTGLLQSYRTYPIESSLHDTRFTYDPPSICLLYFQAQTRRIRLVDPSQGSTGIGLERGIFTLILSRLVDDHSKFQAIGCFVVPRFSADKADDRDSRAYFRAFGTGDLVSII